MTKPLKVHLCVVGASAGGMYLVLSAIQLGYRVALVEDRPLSQIINLNPYLESHLLSRLTFLQGQSQLLESLGMSAPRVNDRGKRMISHMQEKISGTHVTLEPSDLEELGVLFLKGKGHFKSKDILEVDDQQIQARYFAICSKLQPALPSIPGLSAIPFYSYDSWLQIPSDQKHLVILGGGRLPIEISQSYRRMGFPVTLMVQPGCWLKDFSSATREAVRQLLKSEGVEVVEVSDISQIKRIKGGFQISCQQAGGRRSTIKGVHFLIMNGLDPFQDDIDLSVAGIKSLTLDARLRFPENNHIFALGPQFGDDWPDATQIDQGVDVIGRNIFMALPTALDPRLRIRSLLSDPEFIEVGYSEAEIKQRFSNTHTVILDSENILPLEDIRGQKPQVSVTITRLGYILAGRVSGSHARELALVLSQMIIGKKRLSWFLRAYAPFPSLSLLFKHLAHSHYKSQHSWWMRAYRYCLKVLWQ